MSTASMQALKNVSPQISGVSPGIEVKTVNTSPQPAESTMAGSVPVYNKGASAGNILNNYRSVSYNFTLAALSTTSLTDPASYSKSAQDFIILKSGGKGTGGVATPGATDISSTSNLDEQMNMINKSLQARDEIQGFNQNSPGRFDMFIDNVEIETIMAFNFDTGVTLPTKIRFDVFEPYSINGFMEALQVSAVAAGYQTYVDASFLLKVEFVGYPDDQDLPSPKSIGNSTRYFVFGFTGLEVSITETGTKYACAAVPYNERSFGMTNTLKKPVQARGSTVKAVLKDFIDAINKQLEVSDKESKATVVGNDKYDIKFQKWDDVNGFVDSDGNNIVDSDIILSPTKDNENPALQDPQQATMQNAYHLIKTAPAQTATPRANLPASLQNLQGTSPQITGVPSTGSNNATPKMVTVGDNPAVTTVPAINFTENSNIHTCITDIIRYSTYITSLLKNIGQSNKNNPDPNGMIEYFTVRLEVTNLAQINSIEKRPFQRFTYVVSPYKVHYTKIPNYSDMIKDTSKLLAIANRSYNYIYTGENIDVLNFKLNFNTLFFEAIPVGGGTNNTPNVKNSAAPSNTPVEKITERANSVAKESELPTSRQKISPAGTTIMSESGISGGQRQDDSYFALATSMHEAIVNAKASMITGEIEILGDPFFLVTGGMGNYNPKPSAIGVTGDNEANFNYGSVLININFRNPTDIGEDGFMQFSKLLPFSGIYMVTTVNSRLTGGVFKQTLNMLRLPGIIGKSLTPGEIENQRVQEQNRVDQIATDAFVKTALAVDNNAGFRLNLGNLGNTLLTGVPSLALPSDVTQLIDQGLILDVTNATALANLPATPVFSIAPDPPIDIALVKLQASTLLNSNPLTAAANDLNSLNDQVSSSVAGINSLITDPLARRRAGLPTIT